MCRLFGLAAGGRRVTATFWLLEAPDSLAEQSRREPDGTGLGWFADDGTPSIDKQPLAAYDDPEFTRRAHEVRSSTFVAHVRYASTGGLDERNTHPFEQDGRLFAHNGVIEGLDRLDERLGDARELVQGDTDSERFFALITKETRAAGGDVGAGIAAAARWVAAELPLFAINFVLIAAGELWALRYPDTHDLFLLQRDAWRAERLPAPRAVERRRADPRARGRAAGLLGRGRRDRAHGRGPGLAGARAGRARARRRRPEGHAHGDPRRAAAPPAHAGGSRRERGCVTAPVTRRARAPRRPAAA